ncbi:MAG: phage tail sheath subtilisin-like domain-containing protein [Rhodocyclaceae bacterium]|nr:phage tail sheath subtilisin-like domain-containing protein [Rhodocyclaceae bacterium]
MTLIIPGVEVKVVKEVLAPQLAPAGVLGLVGLTEKQPPGQGRAASWNRFIELYGPGSAYSLPQAAQALANGVFELVVVPVNSSTAKAASVKITAVEGSDAAFTLNARAAGIWANGLAITVANRSTLDGRNVFDLGIQRPGGDDGEFHRNLSVDPADARSVDKVLAAASQLATAQLAAGAKLPKDADAAAPYKLAGGKDAAPADYTAALAALENEADVDMVLVALQDFSDPKKVAKAYADVITHCERLSTQSKGRIGFGEVPGGGAAGDWVQLADNLRSDRFVLLAPNGVAGAVAGMVGSLDYFQSPTFKRVGGLTALSAALGVEDQQTLLKDNVVPVVNQRGRGTIVVRGLTTDGDQISVRRVADRAVRGVKSVGDLFIGRLNNELGRGALKQKLVEFLTQMTNDGALVPSTDGTDPPFKVNVYSSQDDFAKGIVRVDLAVRPVRAIDYIYATVLVQV